MSGFIYNMKTLPYTAREVVKMLQGKSFIVTGSTALYLQGHLQRMPKDLDILTCDASVLDIFRNKEYCLDISETIENPKHFRFLLNDCFYVDIFWTNEAPAITLDFKSLKLNVSPTWYVFATKLEKFKDDSKTIEDLKEYFTQVGKLTVKHLKL